MNVGTPVFSAAGVFGGALSMNGTANYLSQGAFPTGVPTGASGYTLAAWVNPTGTPGAHGIVGWGNYGNFNQTNALRMVYDQQVVNYWWSNDLYASAPGSLYAGDPPSGWHHVVAMYNPTLASNQHQIYIDGVLRAQRTVAAPNAQASNFAVGKTVGTEYFNGLLDDVRIYNGAISGAEVSILAGKGQTQGADFSNSLPGFLEIQGPNANVSGGVATFNGSADDKRTYYRTIAGDYYTRNFVAEMDLVNTGSWITFAGLGRGSPDPAASYGSGAPSIGYIYHNPSVGGADIVAWDLSTSGQTFNNFADTPNTGTHRLRYTWDATTKLAVLEVDFNPTIGTFTVDATSGPVNGADNGFTASNGHIYFGGSQGAMYDNLLITSVIPAPTGTLTATLSAGTLTVADTAGVVNTVSATVSGANLVLTDATEQFQSAPAGGTLSNGNKTLTIPLASITGSLSVNLGAGNDTFTANYGGGNFPFAVNYAGGAAGNDKLVTTGGNFATATHTFTAADSGSIAFTGNGLLSYAGLEPVDMTGTTVGNLVFNLPAAASAAVLENYTLTGNGVSQLRSGNGTFETTTFSNPTGSITINRGNAADTLTVTAVPDLNSSVTLGTLTNPFAAFTVSGAVALGAGSNFTSFGTVTTVNAAVSVGGAGTVSMTANQNVAVNANITGGTGGTTLLGKGTAALNTIGVDITNGAVVTATGAGAVNVTGTGSPGGSTGYGVRVFGAGSTITSGGGNVSVTGTGFGTNTYGVLGLTSTLITSGGNGTVTVQGTATANNGVGVVIHDNSTISSGGLGTVSVTGTAQSTGRGVWVFVNSQITSGGGNVTINGSSGAGTTNQNMGVLVENVNAAQPGITSGGNGNVLVVGQAGGTGGSNENIGVWLRLGNSWISSGGTGTVTVQGTGGASGGTGNHGVLVEAVGSKITSAAGTLAVTGTGGSGTGNNLGMTVQAGGSIAAPNALTVTGTKGTNTTTGISVTGAGNIISAGGLATLNGPSASNITIDGAATANFGSLTISAAGATATVFEDSATALNAAAATTVILDSAGAITDNNGSGINVTATSAVLTAAGGIGTAADVIETTVTNLEGTAGAGFFVTNTTALTVGGVSAVTGVSTSTGNIGVTAGGTITVNEAVANTGGGSVTLTSGSTYQLISGSFDYASAQADAALRGGYLATIRSAAENAAVVAVIGGSNPWIGASDAAVEGDWRWVAGPDSGVAFWLGLAGARRSAASTRTGRAASRITSGTRTRPRSTARATGRGTTCPSARSTRTCWRSAPAGAST